ncbi:MAG: signal peptide peptidase SppA [Bryobacterales bacterium]|nr:signal peptide peptidase SppA [Bryobacterales bacterium]
MKKFLVGLLVGVVISVFAGIVVMFAFARLADREPTVPDNSVLRVRLSGPVEEMSSPSIPFPGQPPSGLTTLEIWSTLRKAAVDSRIKAVLFEPVMPGLGWATAQEIRGSIEKFRKESGKPVYAIVRMPRMVDYYMASAADKVYASPEDMLLMTGMRVEAMYLKNTLDKIGVTMEVEHAGKYKDAGDQFTETGMTPETREVLTTVLDDLYNDFLMTTGASRKKSRDEMAAIIDQGPFTATGALKAGLLDGLKYEEQIKDEIKEALKLAEYKETSVRNYRDISASSLGLTGDTSIAILTTQGAIMRGKADAFSRSSMIASESLIGDLRDLARNDSIKGVILRVDSPGGDAIASDEILHAVRELSKKKPMVVSMSDAAASGGYYISMTGDPIVAYPSTLTGSIGVVFTKPVLKGLYDKIGITKDAIERGENAGFLSDYVTLDASGRERLKALIDETYTAFLARVSEGRNRPVEEIAPLAQGRVWLGSQAKDRGLVDELGGFDVAIAALKKKAKIPENDKMKILVYPGKASFFEMLASLENSSMGAAHAEAILKGTPLEPLMASPLLKTLETPGVKALMPYGIEVQ